MNDETETLRRHRLAEINCEPGSRAALEAQHNQVWSTDELREEFEVLGFMAPYVVARRRSDGKRGTLMFSHSPRYYFGWQED